MNKKDCEKISWILAQYDMVHPEMLEDFFNLDERIRDNYEWDKSYACARSRTPIIFERLMTENYGVSWAISKNRGTEAERRQLWKLAEDEAFEEIRRMPEEDDED